MKKLAIVVSRFNSEITFKMRDEAIRLAKLEGAKIIAIKEVPGAFEIPLAAARLLSRNDIDGVCALGAVIKGETKHDEAITGAICSALLSLQLHYKKPIGLGISGPGITYSQAKARIKDYAKRSVAAVLEMSD